MESEAVERVIIEVLVEIQTASGRPNPPIDREAKPIGDVPGFDSLSGLEATVELGARLDCAIPDDVNLFVHERGTRALRVSEIAQRLHRLMAVRVASDVR